SAARTTTTAAAAEAAGCAATTAKSTGSTATTAIATTRTTTSEVAATTRTAAAAAEVAAAGTAKAALAEAAGIKAALTSIAPLPLVEILHGLQRLRIDLVALLTLAAAWLRLLIVRDVARLATAAGGSCCGVVGQHARNAASCANGWRQTREHGIG